MWLWLAVLALIFIYICQPNEIPLGVPMPGELEGGGQSFGSHKNKQPPLVPTAYTVTFKDGAYLINGEKQPELHLKRGATYEFNINTGPGHPFYISVLNDGGGNTYNGELTIKNGVQNTRSSSGQVIFKVPGNFRANQVYYHCGAHKSSGNKIKIT